MTTTISNATLTVTITESVTLNGSDQGATNTLTVSNVDEVYKRILTCPASNTTTIATFNSDAHGAANAIDIEDSKYIRVTNKDDTNAVELAIVGAATLYQVTLAAGQSHILGSADGLMLAEEDTSPSFGTMADIGSIQVNPGGNAVDVEIFIASI
tara:strand:- start:2428 stop:2892 length:465 start_codon:yes stop_codon:yes gene_type:complete